MQHPSSISVHHSVVSVSTTLRPPVTSWSAMNNLNLFAKVIKKKKEQGVKVLRNYNKRKKKTCGNFSWLHSITDGKCVVVPITDLISYISVSWITNNQYKYQPWKKKHVSWPLTYFLSLCSHFESCCLCCHPEYLRQPFGNSWKCHHFSCKAHFMVFVLIYQKVGQLHPITLPEFCW